MRIYSNKTQYHRFAFSYEYRSDKVEFCRILKEVFGWQRFSFSSENEQKQWVFSEIMFLVLLTEKFDNIEIDADVRKIWEDEKGLDVSEKIKREDIAIIKDKTDTDLRVSGIKGDMYDYQKVGVEFLIASGGRAIIADPPGLGKTLQSLGYLTHMGHERTLVVCPASVKAVWEKEIKKWTHMSYIIIDSKTKIDEIPADTKIWIINYDILKKHINALLKIRFDLMIGDECHYLKNHRAQRTKAVRALATHIPHIVLLSGTPLLSRPVEMYTLLNFVAPSVWSNWYDFTRRYCGGKQGRFGYDVSGSTNADELHERIKRYFIRRKKSEVLSQLPPKNRIDVPFWMDPATAKLYDTAENNLVAYLKENKGKKPAEIARIIQAEQLAQLNILRQLCSSGGIKTTEDIIESVIESGEKILVFSSFIEPLNALKEKFKDQAVMITGTTPVGERGKIVDEFQTNPDKKVFLGGIRSAGVGVTLTAAQSVLFMDYSWNPADHQQAEDRIHRPGQEANSVNIYQLHAKGTVADKLSKILKKKQKVFDQIIEGVAVDEETGSVKEIITDILGRKGSDFEPMVLKGK